MSRIVVIDDEAQIRRLLSIVLSARGWEVFLAKAAREGLEEIRARKPELVLLDLNLPDSSGLDALKRLREWSTVPVIVVSVKDSESDIVALLRAGADDYVTKPFFTDVLVARIEAVMRRRMPDLDPIVRSGALELDLGMRKATLAGDELHLTPTEYALLELLARSQGRIVTRDAILKEIWGPAGEAESGNLRVLVNGLRKKIEADPSNPAIVTTEPGVGYRFNPDPAPAAR
jgi:two-component system, OmpR family, KDP operon response regulator KdpE